MMTATATAPNRTGFKVTPTSDELTVGCRNCGLAYRIPAPAVDLSGAPTAHLFKDGWHADAYCPECHSRAFLLASGDLMEMDGPHEPTAWLAYRTAVETVALDGLACIEDYDSTLSRRLRGLFRVPLNYWRPTNGETARRWRAAAVVALVRAIAHAGVHPHLERKDDGTYRDAKTGRFATPPASNVVAAQAILDASKAERGKDVAYLDDAFLAFRRWAGLGAADCLTGQWANVNHDLPALPIRPAALFCAIVDGNDREAAVGFYGALEALAAMGAPDHA
jgi:hypothetical protein